MTSIDRTKAIKAAALEVGFDLVGVAAAAAVTDADRLRAWLSGGLHGSMRWMENHRNKRLDPRLLLDGCRSIVSVALVYYHPPEAAPHPPGIDVACYAWGEDYHTVIKEKLQRLLEACQRIDASIEGRAFTDSAPVMDKYWAERAGLGWRGKNTNLINRRIGSFVFLGELLVTADLVPDAPGIDHCGTCTRCIEACPTDALSEPYVLDARRCIANWTIEERGALEPADEEKIGSWLFGCDICQDVCPWNRDPPVAGEPRLQPVTDVWPADLSELLSMGTGAFRRRFGATSIERTRRRGLVRNAAIVAGNTGLGSREALEGVVADDDAVVAAAAARALVRRDRDVDRGSH